TLRKLRKQSKQAHEGSSEEAFEEVLDNMVVEGTQQKTLGEYSVPTTVSCGSSVVMRCFVNPRSRQVYRIVSSNIPR
ncbi:hypothetical protein PIB30_097960, partial [Stylosanthes scabra]|nr:hypothetical protein [Stylosanthes scabra]